MNENRDATGTKPYMPQKIETKKGLEKETFEETHFEIHVNLPWHEIFKISKKLGIHVNKHANSRGTAEGPAGAIDMFNSFLEMKNKEHVVRENNELHIDVNADIQMPDFSSTASLLATMSNVPNI